MFKIQRKTWIGDGLGLIFAALLGGLLTIALWTVWDALPVTARSDAAWRELLLDPAVLQATLRSLAVVLLASGLAGLIAAPLAFVAAHGRQVFRFTILALGLLPLAMPPFVIAATLDGVAAITEGRLALAVASPQGLPTFLLLVSTYALHAMPVVLLSLFVGLARLDRSQAESARSHGVPDLIAWYRISLPLLTPPFVLAMAFVTIRILGDASVPLAVGRTDLVAPLLLDQMDTGHLSARGAQLAVLLIALNALVVALAWPFLLAPRELAAPTQPTGGTSLSATLIALVFVGTLSLSPLAWLVTQVEWAQITVSPAGLQARVANSLPLWAAVAVALATLGLAASILTRRPGIIGGLVRLTTVLPLILPGPIVAIGLLGLAPVDRHIGAVAPWPTVAAALAVALPILPVIPHLASHIVLRLGRETADLARAMGATASLLKLRLLLPGIFLLSTAIAFIGTALALMETNALLALRPLIPPVPAVELLAQMIAGPMAWDWAAGASVLIGVTGMLLILVTLFLRPRGITRRPHRGGNAT